MFAPRIPPHNCIAKRRNKSIKDCARTFIMERNVSQKYYREDVSIAIYTLNRLQVKKGTNSLNCNMDIHLMWNISKKLEENVT